MSDPLKSIRAYASDYIEILRTKTSPMGMWCSSMMEHPPIRRDGLLGQGLVASQSPDFNLLDYAFWPHIESKACKFRSPNITALEAAVNQEWAVMDEDFMVKVCQAFWKLLMAIVTANGGYIE
ncbi:Putative transposable element [Caligus rogercresseyi]|uniref:Transposable element n=1 Tax=Caligus rogercresseyi TaxID=217165 RepID=A0A7T8JTN0_CALRO|nr:Putative transposable element [Caligus rogercresseyi]